MIKANNMVCLSNHVFFINEHGTAVINERGIAIFVDFVDNAAHKEGDIMVNVKPPQIVNLTFYNADNHEIITPEPIHVGDQDGKAIYIDILTRKIANRRIIEYCIYS